MGEREKKGRCCFELSGNKERLSTIKVLEGGMTSVCVLAEGRA